MIEGSLQGKPHRKLDEQTGEISDNSYAKHRDLKERIRDLNEKYNFEQEKEAKANLYNQLEKAQKEYRELERELDQTKERDTPKEVGREGEPAQQEPEPAQTLPDSPPPEQPSTLPQEPQTGDLDPKEKTVLRPPQKDGRYNEKERLAKIRKMFRYMPADKFEGKRKKTLERKKVQKEAKVDPAVEIKRLIEEFNLAEAIPAEFKELPLAAQYLVIQNLKQRIVDVVKTDAQTQYSEEQRKKIEEALKGSKLTGTAKGGWTSFKASLSKTSDVKKLEAQAFKRIKETKTGSNLIAENFAQLVRMMQGREVRMGEAGLPEIVFINPSEYEEKDKKIVEDYNSAANAFRALPYEWEQGPFGSRKRKYKKAEEVYKKARVEMLAVEQKKREDRQALTDMMQLDNIITMDQLINTHPEVEKALAEIARDIDLRDVGQNVLQTFFGGGGLPNKTLFLGGFTARKVTTGFTAGLGFMSLLATSAAGGVIGSIRGYMRGDKILEENKKQARRGVKDTTQERAATFSAEKLADKLDKITGDIVVDVLKSFEDPSKKINDQNLSAFETRIKYTFEKIKEGEVDFGIPAQAPKSQYRLISSLNQAISLQAALKESTNKELSHRLDKFSAVGREQIDKRQRKFIGKQMLQGALLGTGAAAAGYLVRYVWELMANTESAIGRDATPRTTPLPDEPTITFQSPISPEDSARIQELLDTPIEELEPTEMEPIAPPVERSDPVEIEEKLRVVEPEAPPPVAEPETPKAETPPPTETPKPREYPYLYDRPVEQKLDTGYTWKYGKPVDQPPPSNYPWRYGGYSLGGIIGENISLSAEALAQVDTVYNDNFESLYHDFLGDERRLELVNRFLQTPVQDVLEDIKDNKIGEDQFFGPLAEYFKKIQEVLGKDFNPLSQGPSGQAETWAEFIGRALKTAAKEGKLDKIKM